MAVAADPGIQDGVGAQLPMLSHFEVRSWIERAGKWKWWWWVDGLWMRVGKWRFGTQEVVVWMLVVCG